MKSHSRLYFIILAIFMVACTDLPRRASIPNPTVSPTNTGQAALPQVLGFVTPVGPAYSPGNDPIFTLTSHPGSIPTAVFAASSSLLGTTTVTATATLTVTATLTPTTGVGMPTQSNLSSVPVGATETPQGSNLLRRKDRDKDPCT